jgi:hypothetical protein
MPTYILDILVEAGDLYQVCSWIKTPIWILIRADGLQQSFATRHVFPCPHPIWNCPARLVINLPALDGSHFKATLCTSDPKGQVIPVAASQVGVSWLPCGRPGRLAFPFLNTRDFGQAVGQLTAKASLSLLPPALGIEPGPRAGQQIQIGTSGFPAGRVQQGQALVTGSPR